MSEMTIPDGAPAVLRWLVYTAMGAAALATGSAALVSMWKNLRKISLIQFIVDELTPNSGKSLKDVVGKTAKDVEILTGRATEAAAAARAAAEIAKTALELTRKMDGRTRRIVSKQKVYIEKVDDIATRMNGLVMTYDDLKRRLDQQDDKFARFVVHEARNDLHRSALLAEEKRLLGDSPSGDGTSDTLKRNLPEAKGTL